MRELFETLLQELRQGRNAVMGSIIASSGSTPRGTGARMAVLADGTIRGTIGGGAVEETARSMALEALKTDGSGLYSFNLSANQVADLGMVCGGAVTVWLQCLSAHNPADTAALQAIVNRLNQRDNSWLVTRLDRNGASAIGVCGGDGILTGGPAADPETLKPLLRPRAVLTRDEPAWYVEPLYRAGAVWVFGGGHVARALVPALAAIGFAVNVYEARAGLAEPSRFPQAGRVLCAPFETIGANILLEPGDYAVVMTSGHQADYTVLEQVLRLGLSYVGCIGSRKKAELTRERLLAAGVPEAAVNALHSPIGLPIAAETPEEIAVSIAAELIQHRAGER